MGLYLQDYAGRRTGKVPERNLTVWQSLERSHNSNNEHLEYRRLCQVLFSIVNDEPAVVELRG